MPADIAWVAAAHPAFPAVAALFDDYRAHYGEPSPGALPWLTGQVTTGRLAVAAHLAGGTPQGLISTAILPASLTLGTFWQVRDLYVPPAGRRRGVARALLRHVVEAARAAGARRVSLQTEPDNEGALRLYAASGFRPVEGLTTLSLPLSPEG